MKPERLQQLLEQFPSRRVAVLGDFFLDKYLDVDPRLAERSVETGKVAHQVVSVRTSAGAAGTIVNNLTALGCRHVYAVGVVGQDGEGFELRQALHRVGCDTQFLLESSDLHTPTYFKPRDVTDPTLAGEHNRYDIKNRRPLSSDVESRLIESLDRLLPQLDAVVISDQVEEADCGVVTATVRQLLADRARAWPNVLFWADSRRRIRLFRNVTIKPNQFEAVGRTDLPPDAQIDLASLQRELPELRRKVGASVFVTLGARGMLVSDPEPTLVPAVRVEGPTDPTGAGDSATAGCVLALTSGATPVEAALVGNLVASVTVQQLATTGTASVQQVAERLRVWLEQQRQAGSPEDGPARGASSD